MAGPEAIDQLTPVPSGSGSSRTTPVAVPVPAAALLLAVTVNPIGVPAGTIALSAVLVRVSEGQRTVVVALAGRDTAFVAVSVAVFE